MTETAIRCPDILFCTCCGLDTTIDSVDEFLEGFEAIKADPSEELTQPNWFFWAPRTDLALESPSVRASVALAFENGMVVPWEDRETKDGEVVPMLLAGRALSVAEH